MRVVKVLVGGQRGCDYEEADQDEQAVCELQAAAHDVPERGLALADALLLAEPRAVHDGAPKTVRPSGQRLSPRCGMRELSWEPLTRSGVAVNVAGTLVEADVGREIDRPSSFLHHQSAALELFNNC